MLWRAVVPAGIVLALIMVSPYARSAAPLAAGQMAVSVPVAPSARVTWPSAWPDGPPMLSGSEPVGAPTTQPAASDLLWLHGVGTQLYTSAGKPITLRAVNWYGFEHAPFVPEGLDHAPLDSILQTVVDAGFNSLRLLFADFTVRENPVVTQGLAANPTFRGLHALDIMGIILRDAHRFGLRVILCNSRSEPGFGPEYITGLWYTPQYPASVFTADWMLLVNRFKNESAFVGADLRNEPHLITALTPDIYLNSGPMWGPFHGAFHPDRDWRFAAQTLGNQLLAINPHMLIIVEGVQAYLNPLTNVFSVGWWGSDLVGVKFAPITLSEPSQLVYSAHDYGPILYPAQWFNKHTSYGSLANKWDHFWGYILDAPDGMRAPLFLGEFGTCNFAPYCIGLGRKFHKRQGIWFRSLVRYLHAHPQIGWAYFALNPKGPFKPNEDNFYSLMTSDWRHVHPVVLRGLAPLLPRKRLLTDCCAPFAS